MSSNHCEVLRNRMQARAINCQAATLESVWSIRLTSGCNKQLYTTIKCVSMVAAALLILQMLQQLSQGAAAL